MTSTPLSRPSAASKQTVHNAGPGGAKPAWKSIAAGWSGAVLATGGYAAAADPRWWLPCMGCAVVGSLHARRALRAGDIERVGVGSGVGLRVRCGDGATAPVVGDETGWGGW